MTSTLTKEKQFVEIAADGSLGIFTVVALVLLAWGGLWMRDNYHLHQPRYINVYFHDIAQLSDNANVFVDGVKVGLVEKLSWQSEHRVLARLKITNHSIKLPVGSHFDILNNGIVGAKYVEIMVPKRQAGEPELPEMADETAVEGEDPVRPELALNNIVVGLSRIDTKKMADNFDADRIRLVRAADQLAILADKTMPVIEKALPLENDLSKLTTETTKTSQHLNKLLSNTKFSTDLKETVAMAKDTVETVKSTMHELNLTIKDKDLRADLIAALDKLHSSTADLERVVKVVQSITQDKDLRTDAKEILDKAQSSLKKVDELFKNPKYGTDIRETLSSTRQAIGHLDLVARQLNQILEKRSPLLHMLMGRPGRVKDKDKNDKDKSDKTDSSGKPDKRDRREDKEERSVQAVKHENQTESGTQPHLLEEPSPALR